MRTSFNLINTEWYVLVKKHERLVNVLYASNYIPALILFFLVKSIYSDIATNPVRFFIDNLPLCLVILNSMFIKTWVFDASLLILSALSTDSSEEVSFKDQWDYILCNSIPLIITVYLYTGLVIIGLLLGIVPGLIFMAVYSQAFNFVLISGNKPIDAFKKSAAMTRGNVFSIIKLFLIFNLVPYKGGFFGMPLVNYILWKMQNLGSLYVETPIPPLPKSFLMTKGKKIAVYSIIVALVLLILATFYQISQLPK